MRAILMAAGSCPGDGALSEQFASAMMPIADRPILQHIIESLSISGFDQFDIVVSHQAYQIEEHFGDGTRWGVRIRYHLARDPDQPYRTLLTMGPPLDDSPVLLGHADRLPILGVLEHPLLCQELTLFSRRTGEDSVWTGWAWISRRDVEHLPTDADERVLTARFQSTSKRIIDLDNVVFDVRYFGSYLDSNRAAIDGKVSGLLFGAVEVEPGVWLSRNVVVHPKAQILPPVYIGEDCQVGAGAEIGPNAVVGHGCILDSRCSITDSVLLPLTYVGQGTELHHAIVSKSHLVEVSLGVEMTLEDDLLLSAVSARGLKSHLVGFLTRFFALVGLVIVAPLLLATAITLKLVRGGQVLVSTEALRLPASSDNSRWKTYRLWRFTEGKTQELSGLDDVLLRFLPGLFNVVKGDLRLVGVPPRAPEEVEGLPQDWRPSYLRARSGLITETSLVPASSLSDDDHRVSDFYYVAAGGLRHDLRLSVAYVGRALFGHNHAATRTEPSTPFFARRPHLKNRKAQASFTPSEESGETLPKMY